MYNTNVRKVLDIFGFRSALDEEKGGVNLNLLYGDPDDEDNEKYIKDLNWFSKAFMPVGVVGSLSDIGNLIWAMTSTDVKVEKDNEDRDSLELITNFEIVKFLKT